MQMAGYSTPEAKGPGVTENVGDYSVRTISQAINKYMNFNFAGLAFEAIREKQAGRSVSSSNGQEFLEGLQFEINGRWYDGHITLSPLEGAGLHVGHFNSAHLTITGGSEHRGNYFFALDESGAEPSTPPKKYSGNHSRPGSELPQPLRTEVEKLLDLIGTFA